MELKDWEFNAKEVEELDFTPIPIGDHRVRIASATEKTSSKGNQMVEVVFDVSGYNGSLWHYIVFMPDNTKVTNNLLSAFWNSFDIPQGNLELSTWVGKIGAARVKHEQYNGEPQAKVAYLIKKDKQDNLPAWVEPSNKAAVTGGGAKVPDFDIAVDDDDLPF